MTDNTANQDLAKEAVEKFSDKVREGYREAEEILKKSDLTEEELDKLLDRNADQK